MSRFWYCAISPQDRGREAGVSAPGGGRGGGGVGGGAKVIEDLEDKRRGNRFISELIFLTVHGGEEAEAGINLSSQAGNILYSTQGFTQRLGKMPLDNFFPTRKLRNRIHHIL